MPARNIVATLACVLVVPLLAGCSHSFRPGPGMSLGAFQSAQANCTATSQRQTDYEVHGKTGAVLGAAALFTIIDLVGNSAAYHNCMLAMGAQEDDGKPAPPPTQLAQALVQAQPAPPGAVEPPGPVPASPRYADLVDYRTGISLRAIDTAGIWIDAQNTLAQKDRKSRDLYLVLCGGGDKSSCVMAAALEPR